MMILMIISPPSQINQVQLGAPDVFLAKGVGVYHLWMIKSFDEENLILKNYLWVIELLNDEKLTFPKNQTNFNHCLRIIFSGCEDCIGTGRLQQ